MRAEDFRGPALTNHQLFMAGVAAFLLTAVLAAVAFGVLHVMAPRYAPEPCSRLDGLDQVVCESRQVQRG